MALALVGMFARVAAPKVLRSAFTRLSGNASKIASKLKNTPKMSAAQKTQAKNYQREIDDVLNDKTLSPEQKKVSLNNLLEGAQKAGIDLSTATEKKGWGTVRNLAATIGLTSVAMQAGSTAYYAIENVTDGAISKVGIEALTEVLGTEKAQQLAAGSLDLASVFFSLDDKGQAMLLRNLSEHSDQYQDLNIKKEDTDTYALAAVYAIKGNEGKAIAALTGLGLDKRDALDIYQHMQTSSANGTEPFDIMYSTAKYTNEKVQNNRAAFLAKKNKGDPGASGNALTTAAVFDSATGTASYTLDSLSDAGVSTVFNQVAENTGIIGDVIELFADIFSIFVGEAKGQKMALSLAGASAKQQAIENAAGQGMLKSATGLTAGLLASKEPQKNSTLGADIDALEVAPT